MASWLSGIVTAGVTLLAATAAFADCGNKDGNETSGNLLWLGWRRTTSSRLPRVQPRQVRDRGLVTGLSG